MPRVPAEPGNKPIPRGTVRLYHYTNAGHAALLDIERNGILVKHAKGHTYGEPDGVWASSCVPNTQIKEFIEFYASPKEIAIGGPEPTYRNPVLSEADLREWERGGHNVLLYDDVPPSHFVAVHEPWHETYRRLDEDPRAVDMLNGIDYTGKEMKMERRDAFRTVGDPATDKAIRLWFEDHPSRDLLKGRTRRRRARVQQRPAWTGRAR